jgi:hypothetical protein
MAKPLSEKSKLIREAIEANPGLGNTEVATLLNGHEGRKKDKLGFKAGDVANQRVALKKASGQPPAKRNAGRRMTRASTPPTAAVPMPPVAVGPLEIIERVFALADAVGGMGALKRLVDRLAERE